MLIGVTLRVLAVAASVWTLPAQAQPTTAAHEGTTAGQDLTELSKKSQNPVSDLTAVPFQFNFYTGGDLADRTTLVLNFQPVVPVPLIRGWDLILRTIVPYVDIPVPTDPAVDPTPDREAGLGDIQQEIFLTPKSAGPFIWGVGPILSFPVATNDLVRTGDWGIGPAGVVVFDVGPLLLGILATQVWTFAGDDSGDNLNQFSLQPFVNYNFPQGWAVSFAPLITANWAADDSDERWTIPLGLGVSKVVSIGDQLTTLSLQYYHLVEYVSPLGSEQLRLVVNFMFPRKPAPQ